jgi:hypothetical protein
VVQSFLKAMCEGNRQIRERHGRQAAYVATVVNVSNLYLVLRSLALPAAGLVNITLDKGIPGYLQRLIPSSLLHEALHSS